jgi:hypothetical protein
VSGSSDERRRTRAGSLLRGFDAAVSNNAQAFGFSITVTVTYGVISAASVDKPTPLEQLGFALSSVAAFVLLNLVAIALLDDREPRTSSRTVLIATAIDFLAVGAGVGAAIGLAAVLSGWRGWVIAPFFAGLAYVLVQALEFAVSDRGADDQ